MNRNTVRRHAYAVFLTVRWLVPSLCVGTIVVMTLMLFLGKIEWDIGRIMNHLVLAYADGLLMTFLLMAFSLDYYRNVRALRKRPDAKKSAKN